MYCFICIKLLTLARNKSRILGVATDPIAKHGFTAEVEVTPASEQTVLPRGGQTECLSATVADFLCKLKPCDIP